MIRSPASRGGGRAERFQRLLDGGAAVRDPALAELANLAQGLGPAIGTAIRPAPAFRAQLRERLLATPIPAPRQARPAPVTVRRRGSMARRPIGPGSRRLVAAGITLGLTIGAGAALAMTSADAIPGDRLYEVKRRIEDGRLWLAGGDTARGIRLLDQATTRLEEAQRLLAGPANGSVRDRRVAVTLIDARDEARRGITLLLRAYDTRHDPADLRRLGTFQLDGTRRLADLSARSPDNPQIRTLREVLTGLSAQLRPGIVACGPACAAPGGTPGSGRSPTPNGRGATPQPTTVPTGGQVGAGVGASAGPVPATGTGGTGGATVRVTLPGGGATVVVGPTPSVSACIPVPLVHTC